MEFPSHQGYEIKEKSNIGDYVISREINDLEYTFIFPAGTTKIQCNVSVDKINWCGFTINDQKNPVYWEKAQDGNIDYSKPLTFHRIEAVAEQDEYSVLYRDFLKDSNCKGFKDYDRIFWRLVYVCNGEEITEYFDIKLYDYDSAEKYSVKTANFNVSGLPFAALTGTDVATNHKFAAEYLSQNNFDIVAVQEDFNYHENPVDNLNGFNYQINHSGSIPGGDGLNVFTKNMTIYNETRVSWNASCSILSDGSDELTPKGFVFTAKNNSI